MSAVSFHQYETEPLMLIIEKEGVERPLEGYAKIAVSFDQNCKEGKFHADFLYEAGSSEVDVENSAINMHFTQEESGQFLPCQADVEVNVLYQDRERAATCEGKVNVFRNLYGKEL